MKETVLHWFQAGALTGLCCLLLSGCGDKVETPEAYAIGENSTVTLDSCLDEEEGGKLTKVQAPESEEEKEKDKKKDKDKDKEKDEEEASEGEEIEQLSEKTGDEEENKDEDGEEEAPEEEVYIYTYEEVPAAALDRFAAALTSEEEDFRVIDETEGSAVFARQAVEEGKLFEIAVDWTEEECVVTVSCPEGDFYDAEAAAAAEEPEAEEIMTLLETVDYISTMSPSDLGLEGDSMAAYEVLPVQGTPLVDGEVCRHINVYKIDDAAQTNTFISSYLVGIGKIFRLDPVAGTVERIR